MVKNMRMKFDKNYETSLVIKKISSDLALRTNFDLIGYQPQNISIDFGLGCYPSLSKSKIS